MAWQVLGARFIHGFYQADAEEMGPDPIDGIACKVRVVAAGHPVRQRRPRADAGFPLRGAPVEETRFIFLVLAGDLDDAAGRVILDRGKGPEARLLRPN